MTTSAHIKAIDWALAQGYALSVRDCSEEDYDLTLSQDRAAVIEACTDTELPSVEIHMPSAPVEGDENTVTRRRWAYLLTFSVIDEGIPDETINDYTIPAETNTARHEAYKAFERAVYS